jgi:hypothetical protein
VQATWNGKVVVRVLLADRDGSPILSPKAASDMDGSGALLCIEVGLQAGFTMN